MTRGIRENSSPRRPPQKVSLRPMPFKKVVLPGRVKCGGTEGEIVVAHGRLPSPARLTRLCLSLSILHNLVQTLQFHLRPGLQ